MGRVRPATALADMALFEGRAQDARDILQSGIANDTARHDSARSAEKWIMLAQADMMKGNERQARAAAERAAAGSEDENLLYPAAMIFSKQENGAGAATGAQAGCEI